MNFEKMYSSLERKAFSACQNVNPQTGTIHDYAEILRQVQRAERAINAACNAITRADDRLEEIKQRQ